MYIYREDLDGVEDDGIDAGHLLEEHQSQRDQQGLEIAALQEFVERSLGSLSLALDVHLLDGGELVAYVGVASAEPLQGLPGALRLALADVPPRGLGDHDHQQGERDRQD